MNRVVLLAVLILLIPMGAAANETNTDDAILRGDLKSLEPGDRAQVTATIVNQIAVNDTIRLTLGGDAVNTLIDAEVDDSQTAVTCLNAGNTECLVDIAGNARRDVNISVEATATGQGVLMGTANSTLTDLASSDTLDVSVQPSFGQRFVDAPGIMPVHILVIALAAATLLVLRRQ